MVEGLCFQSLFVLHSPIDLAAVGGAGGHGDVENLGGALRRYFDGPLLVENEFVLLVAPVAIEVLRLAADRGLRNSRLFDGGDDGV